MTLCTRGRARRRLHFLVPPSSAPGSQSLVFFSAPSLLLALRCRALLVRPAGRLGRLQPRPRPLALALEFAVARPGQRCVAAARRGGRRRRPSGCISLGELGQERVQILLLRLPVVCRWWCILGAFEVGRRHVRGRGEVGGGGGEGGVYWWGVLIGCTGGVYWWGVAA